MRLRQFAFNHDLSRTTVQQLILSGLLSPLIDEHGFIFSARDDYRVRLVRKAHRLGFSDREISAIINSVDCGSLTKTKHKPVLKQYHLHLQVKADQAQGSVSLQAESLEEVLLVAFHSIPEIAADLLFHEVDPSLFSFFIRGGDGELLTELPFSEAVNLQRLKGTWSNSTNDDRELRALSKAASTALYRMSHDWKELLQLVGSRRVIGLPNRDWLKTFVLPEDQSMMISEIDYAIRSKALLDVRHRAALPSGDVIWVSSRAVPLLDHHGCIYEWVGAARQIANPDLHQR